MDSNLTAFKDYLLFEKKYSIHTVSAYEKDIEEFIHFLNQEFNETEIYLASYPQIRNWIVILSEKELSSRTINRKIASLKAFFKFLQKLSIVSVSPFLKHKPLKMQKKLQIPFSEAELDKVFNEISFSDDFEGYRDKLIIEMFYATGIRRAELCNIKLSDIDFSSKMLKINGKRNKQRYIPILPILEKQLKDYMQIRNSSFGNLNQDFLFLNKKGVKMGEIFVYRIINSYFSNVSEKVKKSPHVLRHTFATHLLNHGADLNAVKELLGHSSLASTQVYTQSSLAELKKTHLEAHPRNKK